MRAAELEAFEDDDARANHRLFLAILVAALRNSGRGSEEVHV